MREMKLEEYQYLAGVDEAGRGPIAGPVAVGVVCVPRHLEEKVFAVFDGIKDSKQLTAGQREMWFAKMLAEKEQGNLDFAACLSSQAMIDEKGIVFSIRHAMKRAFTKVQPPCRRSQMRVLLDGALAAPKSFSNQITIIRGDETEKIISMASVAAKVLRDRKMIALAKKHPEYGFEKNKGYGTLFHYQQIKKNGTCVIHRLSFLKKFYENEENMKKGII
ncbi:MAG TPA: ribonuclease HII [Candidatus Paceibacterota bacterium]|nr:ribonuclease HII [Candidatus Paceibacterota bacterium]